MQGHTDSESGAFTRCGLDDEVAAELFGTCSDTCEAVSASVTAGRSVGCVESVTVVAYVERDGIGLVRERDRDAFGVGVLDNVRQRTTYRAQQGGGNCAG